MSYFISSTNLVYRLTLVVLELGLDNEFVVVYFSRMTLRGGGVTP